MLPSSYSAVGWLAVALVIACSLLRVGELSKPMLVFYLEAIR